MAAIAPISVLDGKATPASHVFNPVRVDPATYRNNSDIGVPALAQESLVLSLSDATASSDGVQRAKVSLAIPVLEVPNGGTGLGYVAPPKVAFILRYNGEYILPNRATGAQKKDLRVLAMNTGANAQVVAMIELGEKPY